MGLLAPSGTLAASSTDEPIFEVAQLYLPMGMLASRRIWPVKTVRVGLGKPSFHHPPRYTSASGTGICG